MSFEDFIENFDTLNAAHVNRSSFLALDEDEASSIDSQWGLRQYFGSWKEGYNAGRDDDSLYNRNTQFYLKVDSTSEVCSLVVALMHPYSAELRKENKGKSFCYTTMIDMYKVISEPEEINEHLRDGRKLNTDQMDLLIEASQDGEMRELTRRCYLDEGSYVIVASCQEEDANIDYLLRFMHNKGSCALIEKLDN